MRDNFLEKILCGSKIDERDKAQFNSKQLQDSLDSLKIDNTNLQREKNTLIESSSKDKQELLQKIDALEVEKTSMQTKNGELAAQLADTQHKFDLAKYTPVFWLLSQATREKLIADENKYTKVVIKYPARFVGKNSSNVITMDIRSFFECGLADEALQKWVKNSACFIPDILVANPSMTYEQACELAFTRIMGKLPRPYEWDAMRWGVQEFWEYAIETFYAMMQYNFGFDCDSFAILIYILCRIAGIPEEMLRFVAGTTFKDEGHATISMYFPSRGYWVHGNSTTKYFNDDDTSKFKKMGDSSDPYNIKITWWSSTSKYSYQQMVTNAQASEVKRRKAWKTPQNRLLWKAKITPFVEASQ